MENNKLFCVNCGSENHRDSKFCLKCGFNIEQVRKNRIEQISDPNQNHLSDSNENNVLNVSEQNKNVKTNKRTSFNVWAALFGLFYYISKGLWQKGLMIASIGLVFQWLLSYLIPLTTTMTMILNILFWITYGILAPIDLERKEHDNEIMWREIPDLFRNNSVVVITFIASLLFFIMGVNFQPSNTEVENLATETTTNILMQEGIPLSARDVVITEKISDKQRYYRAYAELSNGQTIRITVEYIPRTGDMYDYYVYVEIPYEELYTLTY